MRVAVPLCSVVSMLLLTNPLAGQNVNLASPPEINVQHHASPQEIRDRLSASQVQKDAERLAELCGTVKTDMESVKQGLLAKDTTERLKRMEKLSKSMREELTRVASKP